MPDIALTLTADAAPLQCRHIRPDGRRCGSPSLRTRPFCYHHDLTRKTGPRQPQVNTARAAKANTFNLPTPADLSERTGLQFALGQVLHKIANNELDPRRAGLLLYGLQIASTMLPKAPRSEPVLAPEQVVDEVIDDPELGTVAPATEWTEAEEPDSPARKIIQRWVDEMEGLVPIGDTHRTPTSPFRAEESPAEESPAPRVLSTNVYASARPNRSQRRCQQRWERLAAALPAASPPSGHARTLPRGTRLHATGSRARPRKPASSERRRSSLAPDVPAESRKAPSSPLL